MAIDIKHIDFKNIYEWPAYGRAIILAIICFSVLFLGYFFDFSSLGDEIYKKYRQEHDLKQQLKLMFKTEEDMKESVSEFPKLMETLSQWRGQLIQADNLPDLLNQILKMGTASSVKFSLFAPGTRKEKDGYAFVPIKVVMEGNYNQLASFISKIANLPQLVSVGDFVISKKGVAPLEPKSAGGAADNDGLTCDLTLEVFLRAHKK